MKHSYKKANLSVSSTSSASSTSSLSPGLSPRKGLLSPSEYYLLSTSPPPSPSLPSLIPRHGKKKSSKRSYRRLLLAFGAVTILAWLGFSALSLNHDPVVSKGGQYEIVNGNSMPEVPTVVILHDEKGKKKWTVSIPAHHPFPLPPSQYHEMCQQAESLSQDMAGIGKKGVRRRSSYYSVDPNYIDVGEAQQRGLLPNPNKEGKIGELEIPDDPIAGRRPCSKSLTYVMETSDAGMGDSLMGLWMSYGLAQKEGRAFFVDDTRWPYGNYTTYFTKAPHPNCMPPPVFQRVPCPHSARHLVVSSATFPQTFGPAFKTAYSDSKKPEPQNIEPIFRLLRTGYEALFHLADEGDAQYVLEKTEKEFAKARDKGGMNVGLHIRRGDVHPWEHQYEKDYLPLTKYMDEVREILITKYEHEEPEELSAGEEPEKGEEQQPEEEEDVEDGKIHINEHKPGPTESPSSTPTISERKAHKRALHQRNIDLGLHPRHGAPGITASELFLASDDPDIYSAPEVSRAQRAQDRIKLASKSQLEAASSQPINPWVDEIHGWEGGFFRDQFFGLGKEDSDRSNYLGKWKSKVLAAANPTSDGDGDGSSGSHIPKNNAGGGVMLEDESPDFADPPGMTALAMRQMVGRAYLLDLAVLGQSDAVVCGVSAGGCRILAVMMGWDRAIAQGMWRNVDGGFGWRGLIVPEN
ncbi:hypothetical protein EJ08DRAFT_668022 [Tothia fuscella]|uniref:Uncharacterized protein n=1 Tax=Tothia fuscella TaxID=1048955 RepID=A0A9P4P082_9PEZI|nr:hypothetical protein EJ08DRAFT_668022 [Tothia fuscella]